MKVYNLFTKLEGNKAMSIFSIDTFDKMVVTACTNGDVDFYKDCNVLYKTIKKHTGAVLCVRFNNTGTFLASCGDDGAVIVYDLDLNVINYLKNHKGDVTNVLWTEKYLISVGHDGLIIFYDKVTFKVCTKIRSHENKITGIAANKKNNFICTQGDDGIVLYKGHVVYKKIPPNEGVILESFFSRMSWSPDGTIFSCGLSFNQKVNSIEIYNIEMESKYSLLGHVAPCEVTCFNPKMFSNSTKQYFILAVGSQDLSISLWNTLSPYPFLLIKNVCELPILDLSWSDDGTILYYCSYDGSVGKLEFNNKELGDFSDKDCKVENSDLFLTLLNAELYDKKVARLLYQDLPEKKICSKKPSKKILENKDQIDFVNKPNQNMTTENFKSNNNNILENNKSNNNNTPIDNKNNNIPENNKSNNNIPIDYKSSSMLIDNKNNNIPENYKINNTPIDYKHNNIPEDYKNNNIPENNKNNNMPIEFKDHNLRDFKKSKNLMDYKDHSMKNQNIRDYKSNNIPENFKNNNIPENYKNNNIPENYKHNNIPFDYKNNNIPFDYKHNNIPFDYKNNNIPIDYKNNNISMEYRNIGEYKKSSYMPHVTNYPNDYIIPDYNLRRDFMIKQNMYDYPQDVVRRQECLNVEDYNLQGSQSKITSIKRDLKDSGLKLGDLKDTGIKLGDLKDTGIKLGDLKDKTFKPVDLTSNQTNFSSTVVKSKEVTNPENSSINKISPTTKVIKRKVVKPVVMDDVPKEITMFNFKQSVKIENGVIKDYYKEYEDYSIELNPEKTKIFIKRLKKDFYEIQGDFKFICSSKKYICVYTTNIEIYELKSGTLVIPFIGAGSVIYMDIYKDMLLFLEGDGTIIIFNIKNNTIINSKVPRYDTVLRIKFSKLYFIVCEYKDSSYILDKQTKLWYLLHKEWNDVMTKKTDFTNTVDETLKKLENKFLINFINKRHDKLKRITRKMIKIFINLELTDYLENMFKKIFKNLIKLGHKKFTIKCLEKLSKNFNLQYFIIEIMKSM